MNDYMAFCFEQQDNVLGKTDMSKDDFVPYWSKTVSDKLGLEYKDVLAIYDRANDVHNTEMNTRAIWKYGSAKGVSGTPIAFINGVKLDSFPGSTDAWVDLIQTVHKSQWKGTPKGTEGFLQKVNISDNILQ